MDTANIPETAKERGIRRLFRTVALLRSGAQDTDEAAVYLYEEKRLGKLLRRLESHPEGASCEAGLGL